MGRAVRRIADVMQFMDNAGNTEGSSASMHKVPAGEFQRNIGRYQDMALTQPVAVTRNGRERTVLISADEYQRLKRRDRQVLTLSDFTEADIAALEATRAPESSKAFDHEMQQ
jgi:prevent-host-death family protein